MRIELDAALALSLTEHADQHRPERPILLAVDQEDLDCRLAVRRGLPVPPVAGQTSRAAARPARG
jgi:hypothetical protein